MPRDYPLRNSPNLDSPDRQTASHLVYSTDSSSRPRRVVSPVPHGSHTPLATGRIARRLQPQQTLTPDSKPKRKLQLVVQVKSNPRYVRGQARPLPPISLLPPHDSTGYIVDMTMLPPAGELDGHLLPRRPTYIVGWTDLPGARLLVPAFDVLDYVSPRAYEAWQADLMIERAAERRLGPQVATVLRPNRAGPSSLPGSPEPDGLLADILSRDPVGVDRVADKKDGPSLSTPKKRRLDEIEIPETDGADTDMPDESEADYDDEVATAQALYQQLHDQLSPRSGRQATISPQPPNPNRNGNPVGKSNGTEPSPRLLHPSGPSSSVDTHTSPRRSFLDRSSPPPKLDRNGHTPTTVSVPTAKRAVVVSPTPVHPFFFLSRRTVPPRQLAAASTPPSQLITPTSRDSTNKRPRLAPPESSLSSSFLDSSPSPNAQAAPHTLAIGSTPLSGSQRKPSNQVHPFFGVAGVTDPILSSASDGTPRPKIELRPARQRPLLPSFKARKPRPSLSSIGTTAELEPATPTSSASAPVAPGDAVWTIQRIEDVDEYVRDDGVLVRYFRVRWVGDWPPDQNPTWEPEDDLPGAMVRDYMRRRATTAARGLCKLSGRVSKKRTSSRPAALDHHPGSSPGHKAGESANGPDRRGI